jgi:hypothetical protein
MEVADKMNKISIERLVKNNLSTITDMAGTSSLEEAWEIITNDKELADEIARDFGYSWSELKQVCEKNGFTYIIKR